MDYEQKYKEALERAKELCYVADTFTVTIHDIITIFPELKESNDDRIVRCLLNYFNHVRYNGLDLKGTDIDEVIAWLEKQGEQNSVFTMPPFKAENFYVSKVDGKIHDITYNPTDNVEPKFRVGDWISGYYTSYKVMAINSKGYMVEDIDGNKINILFENEKFYHLFTIEDAKAGDVLVDVYGNIGIFNKCYNFDWISCCSLGNNGGFQYFTVEHENEKTYPATKEQRDLLFSKMKEAGYEWDGNKKELKKMEAVSKESEDERIKKTIIRILKGEIGYTSKEDVDKYVAWLEKQDEKKSADKAEPKFKVGVYIVPDNITSSEIWKVINIEKDGYYSIQCITNPEYDEIYRVPAFILEKDYRLWTIADAKDGDVLMTTKTRNCPFIYRKTDYNNNLAYYYAGVDGNGDFCEGCLKRTIYHFGSVSNVVPATKEQRDLLFQKMKEAGYKWDSEKKELKRLRLRPLMPIR